jgi:hypothetical protein
MSRYRAAAATAAAVVATLALPLAVVPPATSATSAAAATAAAKRKPDGYIRLVDGPWVGRGEYFASTPFETTSELEVQGAGTYAFRYRIHNRGTVRDSFDILAGRWSTPPADCGFKVVRRGVNITKKITTTGYVEESLAAGDKTTYKVRISAGESDDQCSLEFRAASTEDFGKRDVVIATVANTA